MWILYHYFSDATNDSMAKRCVPDGTHRFLLLISVMFSKVLFSVLLHPHPSILSGFFPYVFLPLCASFLPVFPVLSGVWLRLFPFPFLFSREMETREIFFFSSFSFIFVSFLSSFRSPFLLWRGNGGGREQEFFLFPF